MKRTGIRHLPILSKGKLVGIVSDRDLRRAEFFSDTMELFVADMMTENPYSLRVGTPLSTVASEMALHKYGCTVIKNNEDEIVGIFRTTDGMRLLSEALTSGSGVSPIFYW